MPFDIIIAAVLILLGIFFLLVEIFLLPGISIAGIGGTLLLLGGIVYSYIYLGTTGGNIALALSVIMLAGTFAWLVKSKSIDKIALKTDIDQSVDNSQLKKIRVGDTGTAVSRLNPIGNVLVNEILVEGKTADGEFIDEDTEIEVVKVETYNILVKKKEIDNTI